MSYFTDVKDFMWEMNQIIPNRPTGSISTIRDLRYKLVSEETNELLHELMGLKIDIEGQDADTSDAHYQKCDLDERLARIAQESADVLYVVLGTCVSFGIPFEDVWALVTKANMAKADGPVREDGKKMKPEGWESPAPKIRDRIRRAM